MSRSGKRIVLLSVVVLSSLQLGFSEHHVWRKMSGFSESEINAIANKSTRVYIAAKNSLYTSDDGQNFVRILSARGEESRINDIVEDSALYAATDNGLYESLDQGQSWQHIYHPSDSEARQCLSILERANTIYLGTAKGLFINTNGHWQEIDGFLKGQPIRQILDDEAYLFVATDHKLFRFKEDQWQEIFSMGLREELIVSEEETIDQRDIRYVQVSDSRLLMATIKGIYLSLDHGDHWQNIPAANLPLGNVTSLLKSKDGLFASTSRGVFEFVDDHWQSLHQGMETSDVRDIAMAADGKIYAATDRGVFVLESEQTLPLVFQEAETQRDKEAKKNQVAQTQFPDEPTIHQVHDWTIEYGEVHPDKIKEWRRLAQKRAWVPQLDIGVDGSNGRTIADSIYGTTSSGGSHHIGPDDKSFDQDFGWDVTLSWDLADLIYSSDQTTIDSRSKLMVELREDLLDQVTRLYFERRRLQFELARAASADAQWQFDQQMRIDELTALIDAMTGGKFSKGLNQQP